MDAAGFLNDALYDKVQELSKLKFPLADGGEADFLTQEQTECLLVRKGTLTEKERSIIESHVEYTSVILKDIHFGNNYDKVALMAARHHEYLDGSGYPEHVSAQALSTEMRLLHSYKPTISHFQIRIIRDLPLSRSRRTSKRQDT